MNRRSFIAMSGATIATGARLREGLSLFAAQAGPTAATNSTIETTLGKLRGRIEDGVHTFKGVPYGASTAGAARFLPPSKPRPWTGVRDAIAYGPRAPQPFRRMVPEIGDALVGPGPTSEECLLLNVWTPGPSRSSRRPVMVWLHGGGFRTGSGNSIFYEGKALARKHGVVVVTVTHRLNALGFLYLAEIGGEQYRNSSNVGMQDIVLALEWVRDNIDRFGGNPSNVTVFGQSGGGGKTAILTGMPAAKGLFHRAIIQSTLWDTAIEALEPHEASAATELLFSRLGLKTNQFEVLQKMPTERLMSALTGVDGVASAQGGVNGGRRAAGGDISLRYVPVKDGRTLTVHPFHPGASELSATVPMMCGSNETEGVPYQNPDDPFWTSEIEDEAALRAQVKRSVRVDDAEADRLIALYRKNHPTDSRGDLALIMAADNSALRLSAYAIAERKSAQGKAPVYAYLFKWRSPVNNGKLRSMHCMEVPFVFDHVDNTPFMNGTGADRYALAAAMSEAWVSFARSGDPNHGGLPRWPAFDATKRATMVFDTESRAVNDPYGEERLAMQAVRERNSGRGAGR
jgi:para-nitrobenzyl esterase